ncbi:MAG: hypothetical protein RLO81_00975, partial [Fulvivirga sp.]|uniref:hypothetical protein n=1 Tax=Fulvivirga sp. TaxID=1931237 RepID=UPI0032EACBDA
MKYVLSFLLLFVGSQFIYAQSFSTDPAFPTADAPLSITIDLTGDSDMEDETDVWIWAFLPENCSTNCDAPTNINPVPNDGSLDEAKFSPTGNPNEFTITFTPTDFFNKPAEEITKIGFLAKASDWPLGQTQDFEIDISMGELAVSISSPSEPFLFIDLNESVTITANASTASSLTIFQNGSPVASNSGSSVTFSTTISTSGTTTFSVSATSGSTTVTDEVQIIVRAENLAARPSGIIPGINYSANT